MVDDSLNQTANLPTPPDEPSQFILYQTEDGQTRVEVRFFAETVWLSQKAMGELFQKDVGTINEHIRNIFSEGELHEPTVIRKSQTTASDGKQYDSNARAATVAESATLQAEELRIAKTKESCGLDRKR